MRVSGSSVVTLQKSMNNMCAQEMQRAVWRGYGECMGREWEYGFTMGGYEGGADVGAYVRVWKGIS